MKIGLIRRKEGQHKMNEKRNKLLLNKTVPSKSEPSNDNYSFTNILQNEVQFFCVPMIPRKREHQNESGR